MNIQDIRTEYAKLSLDEESVEKNPIAQFDRWFKEAIDAKVYEANAMILSTVNQQNRPSSRVVLLKGFDEKGFVFYTNYESRKSKEIGLNPNVSLVFFWPELERQIRIEGTATRISTKESMAYFFSRPVTSRIGAWASAQSAIIEGRKVLEKRVEELKKQFKGEEVPYPEFWGGYRIEPSTIEFWQGRPSRLHDRLVFRLSENKWEISRLSP